MKQLLMSAALLGLLVAGCKKEEEPLVNQPVPNPVPQSIAYFPLDSGSYWVYEHIRIDTNGNETFMQTDSARVVGDTIIGGNTYTIIRDFGFAAGDLFVRDSANCIVSSNGAIFIAANLQGQQIAVETVSTVAGPAMIITDSMDVGNYPVSLNSGNYSTLQRNTTLRYLIPPTTAQPHAPYRTNFATGIGMVRNQYIYASQPHLLYERRLLRYHIQ